MMASGQNGSDSGASDTRNSGSGGSNKTGIIVGVVVGVGVPLILAALIGGFLMRRRRQEKEARRDVEPYVVDEKALARSFSSGTNGNDTAAAVSTAGPAAAAATLGNDNEPLSRRVVQEEDAEEVEYLPPRYREAWQHGSSDDPSAPRESEQVAAMMSPVMLPNPADTNDIGSRDGPPSPQEPARPLKEDYLQTFGLPQDSAAVALPTSMRSQSPLRAAGPTPLPRDLETPAASKGPREPGTIAGGPSVGSSAAVPSSQASMNLKSEYKRAFP